MNTIPYHPPSDQCYAIIKHFEGCKLKAYQDSVGVWTIGYGNTFYGDGSRVKPGDVITQAQANDLLPIIVKKFAMDVYKFVKRPLLQHEYDALVSFTYNVGIGNFEKSTLLKKVNNNAPGDQIQAEFAKWNKAGGKVLNGLIRRRNSEAVLYATGKLIFSL